MWTESEIHGMVRWLVWKDDWVRYGTHNLFRWREQLLWHSAVLFWGINERQLKTITSIITLLEVLVQPYHHEDEILAGKYKEILLHSDNLLIVPVSSAIADKAAELRARYGIRTPDAIQIATALQGGSSIFLTNDRNLKKIHEIEIITLYDIEKGIKT